MPNIVNLLSTYMFGTPDFGHSDIWHFNFALKFLLSQSLKAGHFPFWSKDIGTGFPLLAEGQIGMFNLQNILLFKFFNPVLAFNLGLILIVSTTAIGTYLFCRVIKLSRLSSFFAASIFSLSGVFIAHIVHFNLIQAASYLPWEFFLTEKFFQTKQKSWLFLFSLILQQQIFAGFQQLTLISLVGVGIYTLVRAAQSKNYQTIIYWLLSCLFGLVLSLPQIIPTQELIQRSFRQEGVSIAEMTRFPFQPKFFLNFINPYFWGDPRISENSDYNIYNSIFWESTGYIGLIPLSLFVAGFFFKKRSEYQKPFLIITIMSLILLLGKSTPFFFVFQIPPLSFFRVPARFLFLFVWSLTILGAMGIEKVKHQKVVLIILLVSLFDLIRFDANYNPIINAREWLAAPQTVSVLKKDPDWFRVLGLFPTVWNDQFYNRGWRDMQLYWQLRGFLNPNENLYWGMPSLDLYSGVATKRFETFSRMVNEGISIDVERKEVKISSVSAKLLSLSGVKYVISPFALTNPQQNSTFSDVEISQNQDIHIIKNSHFFPHTWLTRDYKIVSSLDDLIKNLSDPNSTAAILEEEINISPNTHLIGQALVVLDSDQKIIIQTESNDMALLILSNSYYPHWQASIDGHITKILPANLNQQAIIVPGGNHLVTFSYKLF